MAWPNAFAKQGNVSASQRLRDVDDRTAFVVSILKAVLDIEINLLVPFKYALPMISSHSLRALSNLPVSAKQAEAFVLDLVPRLRPNWPDMLIEEMEKA